MTPDYLIGPGDELLIRAWGQIDIDYRATVDRNGAISIPRVGSIQVAGLKYKNLTPAVKQAVSKNFRNFELLVTMGQLRSIQIFVVLVEGPIALNACVGEHPDCFLLGACGMNRVWAEGQRRVMDLFQTTTVASVRQPSGGVPAALPA